MDAILVNNLSLWYGEKKILDNICYKQSYGTINLISGSSGCGKSSFIYLLNGIIPNLYDAKFEGTILINGKNIKNKKIFEISHKIGTTLQNPDEQILNEIVEDEISFGMENFNFHPKEIKKQIDYVTELLKLNPSNYTKNLSGGQKQRLIISSILAMKQKIIILDEPFANLDKNSINIIIDALIKLKNKGYAILILEHRLDQIKDIVDNIYDLSLGKLEKISNKLEYINNKSKIIPDNKKKIKCDKVLFKLENISKKFKNKSVLENVNLKIYKGERITFLGDNGAGKTTLLKIIARILKPTGGKIIQSLDKKLGKKRRSKKWFKKVGYIFQNPNYQLFMPTVYKEIYFSSKDDKKTLEILKTFDLEKLKDAHPQSLSEGQKRRVSIAAVIASSPKVLLLDEPTVGQDFEKLKDLVNIINNYCEKENATLITITHDKRCIYALSDRAVIFKDKTIHKILNKDELLNL